MADELGAENAAPLIARQHVKEAQVPLPFISPPKEVAEDYRTTRLSLKAHPVSFFRKELTQMRARPCADLKALADRSRISVGGLVLVRQRPGTAKGVVFLTLEDESGIANIVCWKDVFEANRRLVMGASFLVVHGQVQEASDVIHVVAEGFTDLSARLGEMRDHEDAPGAKPAPPHARPDNRLVRSRDFH